MLDYADLVQNLTSFVLHGIPEILHRHVLGLLELGREARLLLALMTFAGQDRLSFVHARPTLALFGHAFSMNLFLLDLLFLLIRHA